MNQDCAKMCKTLQARRLFLFMQTLHNIVLILRLQQKDKYLGNTWEDVNTCQHSRARIWHRFGDAMVAKLRASPKQSGEWQHCADEGQICLCLGEVRFGLESLEANASHKGLEQWASETLVAKNGLVFCTEDG